MEGVRFPASRYLKYKRNGAERIKNRFATLISRPCVFPVSIQACVCCFTKSMAIVDSCLSLLKLFRLINTYCNLFYPVSF